MLTLHVKDADICEVSDLLEKYNIKASITSTYICIDAPSVPTEIITQLNEIVKVTEIQNFHNEKPIPHVYPTPIQDGKNSPIVPNISSTYDVRYFDVKRGQIYWCDFGTPYCYEQGYIRPAIVVQSDTLNALLNTTCVLPCTTTPITGHGVHKVTFTPENVIIDDSCEVRPQRVGYIKAYLPTPVDKSKLRGFIGTATPELMKQLTNSIGASCGIPATEQVLVPSTPKVKTPKSKKTKVKTPKSKKTNAPASAEFIVTKTVIHMNEVQSKIISLINKEELEQISLSDISDHEKIERILLLWKFNINHTGVKCLARAIEISLTQENFTLESLSKDLSREMTLQHYEIMRLIVARIKENFKMKQSPSSDFIRLVKSYLTAKERFVE